MKFDKAVLRSKGCCHKLITGGHGGMSLGGAVLENVTVERTDDWIVIDGTEIEYKLIMNWNDDGYYVDHSDCIIPDECIIKTALWGLITYSDKCCWRVKSGWYPKKEKVPFHMKINKFGGQFAIF